MMEIAENLDRAELTALERGVSRFLGRLYAIHVLPRRGEGRRNLRRVIIFIFFAVIVSAIPMLADTIPKLLVYSGNKL